MSAHPEFPHAHWRKSAHSGEQGACVELADVPDAVAVRDSKDPEGPVLRLRRKGLASLINRVRSGELDL